MTEMAERNGSIVVEFARRTMENLLAIESAETDGHERREVTQLINSLLGLVILPQQSYLKSIPDMSANDLKKHQWPKSFRLNTTTDRELGLHESVTKLRHAVAHSNIKLESSDGLISKVNFWNRPPSDELIDWSITIPVQDLRTVVEKLARLYDHGADDSSSTDQIHTRSKHTVGKYRIELICIMAMLLYPPMQSTRYNSSYSETGGRGIGVGGRQFDGWGPFWEIISIDWDDLGSALDVGDFLEGGYSIEWPVLIWQMVILIVILRFVRLLFWKIMH